MGAAKPRGILLENTNPDHPKPQKRLIRIRHDPFDADIAENEQIELQDCKTGSIMKHDCPAMKLDEGHSTIPNSVTWETEYVVPQETSLPVYGADIERWTRITSPS